MNRKKTALLLSVMSVGMLLGTLPVAAEEDTTSGTLYEDLEYEIADDGHVVITNCLQSATTCTVPEEIDGAPVTEIGDDAFAECYFLETLELPDTITTIGRQAFSACSTLETLVLPDTVTSMGEGLFDSCESLKTVVLPANITELPQATFYECTALVDVTLPQQLVTIGSESFYGCTALQRITLPEGTENLDDYAFQGCTALETFHFPASLVNVGGYFFEECTALTEITVDDANEMFVSQDGVLFTKDGTTLVSYPPKKAGTTYTIPEGCTTLANGSFLDALYLQSVDLGSAVNFGQDVFFRCTALEEMTIPEGVTELGTTMFAYCSSLRSVTLPSTLQTIGDYCFFSCDSLTEVTVPEGTQTLGGYCFFNCPSLKTLHLPDSLTEIGDGAMGYYTVESESTDASDDADSEDDEASTELLPVEDFVVDYGENQVIYEYVQQYSLTGTGTGTGSSTTSDSSKGIWIAVGVIGGILVLVSGIALIVHLRRKAAIPKPVPGGRTGSATKRPDPNKKGKS
jgi:hypothetical protein